MNVNIHGHDVQNALYNIGNQSAKYTYPEYPLKNAK
jgi:hypothetical protein